MKVMDLVIRKNIIILLMLLTVAGGAFDTFLRDKTKPQEITENPLVAFVTEITQFIVKDISEKDRYTIKRITEGWQQDPLISLKDQPEPEPKKKIVIPDPNVSYTGFMRLGDIKFAIINGIAYTTGDQLAQGGYVVGDITPRQVEIVSTRHNKQAYVFLLEE
ncbi:MAG: hypothetical protein PVG34_07860 [Desulfobacterales bacterium]